MRKVAVITVARSDYGILTPLLRAMKADPDIELCLIAGGMHLEEIYGRTEQLIEDDGFTVAARIKMDMTSDSPEGIAHSIGLGVSRFADALASLQPDMVVILGDRFDMFAAAVAALPLKIPVAHLHGGELTQGATDDAFRHSMTKLSHLHFVSTEAYAQRVLQMGEEPWRVAVCGALALDHLAEIELLEPSELAKRFGFSIHQPPLLVTFHPVTLEFEDTEMHVRALLSALEKIELPTIFTLPNADTMGQTVIRLVREFSGQHEWVNLVENMGMQAYFSMMSIAAAMVGNSSSGILEAPSFHLPVVNIGTRQDGRMRASNVIDVGASQQEINEGIRRALDSSFKDSLIDKTNPYDRGGATPHILKIIKDVDLGSTLIRKSFQDIPIAVPADCKRHG